MGQLSMTKDERESFLAGVHIGVLAVNGSDGGAAIATPIWYAYEPGGDVLMETAGTSSKAVALRAAGAASLCAQTETAPYQYVVVEGLVTLTEGVDTEWRRSLAHRYLGAELGDLYMAATMESEVGAVSIRLTPERWRTVDYAKQWG